MRSRGLLAALLVVGAVSVALRWPFLAVPLNSDEGGYAYTAHWMLRGLRLYRDLWFDRPQGTFLIYAGVFRVFGESAEAIRLGAGVYNAITVLLLGLLGRTLFGPAVGVAAAGLFAVTSAAPQVEGFTANGELLMNLPVVLAVLLAVHRRWFLTGLVAAVAFAVKPTAVLSVVPPVTTLAIVLDLNVRGLGAWTVARVLVRRLAACAAGGVAGLSPFVAHGVASDPTGYWYAVVGFRVEAHSAFSVGEAFIRELVASAPSVLIALLPLWALAAASLAGAAVLVRRDRALNPSLAGAATGAALLAGGLLGAAAGGYWYWHYYVGLLPGASLLAAPPLVSLVTRVRERRLAAGSLAAGTLVAVAFNARLVGATPLDTSWRLYQRPSYLASRAIADYVRTHTTDKDAVYATFAEAELYYLAERRSAGMQLYWTEINRVPGAYERVLETLDDPERRPAYVVAIDDDLETRGRAAAFWERVRRYYKQEASIHGFRLFHVQMPALRQVPFLRQDASPEPDDERLGTASVDDEGGDVEPALRPDGTDVRDGSDGADV